MSENVEIVTLLYDAFRRRDNETPFEYFAEDVVWDTRGAQILGLTEIYHGHDGVRAFWRQWLDAWDEIDFELEETTELPDGRVRLLIRQRNRGRGTGIWIDQKPYYAFWTLADEKVKRVEYSWDVED